MKEIDKWTAAVNEVVNTLKCELDGGFLEDTRKYDGESEEIIYSCLRAIAVQIVTSPTLAIVDRDAKWPEPHMHPPEGVLIRFMSDLKKAGWVKEIN